MTIEDQDIVYPGDPGLNDPAAFPARLEALIGGMSVRAFARKAGVSDTFLRQCLAGRTEPTRTKLLAIAEAGGTTVEWIATGRAEPSDQPAVADRPPIDRELLESIIEIAEQVRRREQARGRPQRTRCTPVPIANRYHAKRSTGSSPARCERVRAEVSHARRRGRDVGEWPRYRPR